jgi:Cu/Ag efflux pump CusA
LDTKKTFITTLESKVIRRDNDYFEVLFPVLIGEKRDFLKNLIHEKITDAKFKDGSYEYDTNVIYDESNRRSISDVSNLIFINSIGQQIKLSQFAEISYSDGSSELERNDQYTKVATSSVILFIKKELYKLMICL